MFTRLTATAAWLTLSACSVIQQLLPVSESPAEVNQRAAVAMATLRDLENIDAVIRLDNDRLLSQIEAVLQAQAQTSASFSLNHVRVNSGRQVISIYADLNVFDGREEPLSADLRGDVLLSFSGGQLIWLPHFNSLTITDTEFTVEGQLVNQPPEGMEDGLLQQVNRDIADAVIVLGKNVVRMQALPLGNIEVGASLTDFAGLQASGTHELGGVFTVAGSTILIEPSVTSIALDLGFVPNISACPADVYVSRSTFASEIRNREPVGITRIIADSTAESHFFTEISGATRSTAVIHYWFADGVPVWVEELPVEPSYRWRTWSSKLIERGLARNWEVIVVEKETGCILHSQAIRVDAAAEPAKQGNASRADTYEALSAEFEKRIADFTIRDEKPEVALIQVRREFIDSVLHTSLKDIQVVVNFDAKDLPPRQLTGVLEPFNADEVVCEERSCTPSRSCPTGFTQCVRERDTRDCSRCLFRNPLNNRCVTEGTDPICEAAKTAQNAKHDAERDACLEQEAAERADCQKLVAQEMRSCEMEASSERTACEDGKAAIERSAANTRFADINLKFQTSGGLSAVFSNFAIEGDLESLRMSLGLSGALTLDGSIRFAPGQGLGPLAACMNSWQKSFNGRVVLPYRANEMIASMTTTPAALTADWSGYSLAALISPAPLEAMFVDDPSLLANCHIGLTVDKVAREISGPASDYLVGRYKLEIQPLQSRISLSPASVSYGEMTYQAPAALTARHLTYQVED